MIEIEQTMVGEPEIYEIKAVLGDHARSRLETKCAWLAVGEELGR